ncbi:MAG TPA: hypothetical protein PKC43_14320 [Phycisphaerales bacterium]|nr:hypothetical protein [Phycisphaerales bacterium]HMP38609.1 hypothetical protein [Phycisphaerales bacterium]
MIRRRGKPTKERLEALVRIARFYRGWPAKEIAAHLDRHVHNLVPESGVPKVDLVVGLADLLDWPVEVVIASLYRHADPASASAHGGTSDRDAASVEARLRAGWELLENAKHAELVEACQALLAEPLTDDQFAYGSLLIAFGYERLGRYSRAAEAAQSGLARCGPESPHRGWLRMLLAYSHYVLGNLDEAEGIATQVILDFASAESAATESYSRRLLANAHYVRGSCRRALASRSAPPHRRTAELGLDDFATAESLFRDTTGGPVSAEDESMADRCESASLELLALTGAIKPRVAVDRIIGRLGEVELESARDPHAAETVAWACVFGSNIVVRHLGTEPDADRLLAILTTAADAVARNLGHWVLRERVWTIEHLWRRSREGVDDSAEWVLDREDLETLVGTIGRFPRFLDRGLETLESWREQGEALS